MQDSSSAIIEALEDLAGDHLGEHERMVIRDLSPPERVRYYRQRERELEKDLRTVAIQEAHRAFLRGREKLATVLSSKLTMVVAGLTQTLEEAVPIDWECQTGKMGIGQWPPLPRGRESCLRTTSLAGLQQFEELLRQADHLPPKLEAFTVKEDVDCILHRGGPHPAALVFEGIPDVEALGLKPCSCGGTPEKHRYRVTDVRLRVGPFVWPPGSYFDSPCDEAEEALSKYVVSGSVKDLRAKGKAPVKPTEPSPQRVLEARLEALGTQGGE